VNDFHGIANVEICSLKMVFLKNSHCWQISRTDMNPLILNEFSTHNNGPPYAPLSQIFVYHFDKSDKKLWFNHLFSENWYNIRSHSRLPRFLVCDQLSWLEPITFSMWAVLFSYGYLFFSETRSKFWSKLAVVLIHWHQISHTPPLKFWWPKPDQNLAFFLPHLTLCVRSFVRRQIFHKQTTFCQSPMFFLSNDTNINNFFPVRCLLRVTFTLLTMFVAQTAEHLPSGEWKKRIVGSLVARQSDKATPGIV